MIKNLIKNTPLIGSIAKKIKKNYFSKDFTTSGDYWDERYEKGGNSGAGSYNHLANFKAEVINNFIQEKNIDSVIEFGSGDGNQLKYMNYNSYIGFDVSKKAIEICENLFANDSSKTFLLVNDYKNHNSQLTLSLDVIYHLVEDLIFENYMAMLFDASQKYVIIYSSNHSDNSTTMPHVRNRIFSTWITQNRTEFKLIKQIKNKYSYKEGEEKTTSIADFFIYEKVS